MKNQSETIKTKSMNSLLMIERFLYVIDIRYIYILHEHDLFENIGNMFDNYLRLSL